MLEATCHCGRVRITVDQAPRVLRQCNCSICRRYGAMWAYYQPDQLKVRSGADVLVPYEGGPDGDIRFYHCSICGCVTHYETVPGVNVPPKSALNVRTVVNASAVAHLPIELFDGASSWSVLWTHPQPDLFG